MTSSPRRGSGTRGGRRKRADEVDCRVAPGLVGFTEIHGDCVRCQGMANTRADPRGLDRMLCAGQPISAGWNEYAGRNEYSGCMSAFSRAISRHCSRALPQLRPAGTTGSSPRVRARSAIQGGCKPEVRDRSIWAGLENSSVRASTSCTTAVSAGGETSRLTACVGARPQAP